MCVVQEVSFIGDLVKNFPRSAQQINRLQESDAELLRLDDGSILALTTDSVCEELDRGLYDDPQHIGWMTVAVNLSDLAAVGASPLGLLLNQTFARSTPLDVIAGIQQGIADACVCYGCPVFGGDTNFSERMQMSATAIGIVHAQTPLMRTGCSTGDALYASGMMGAGNAYAVTKLAQGMAPFSFIPTPRNAEGRLLLHHASCCIDTSDGLFAAVDQLMRVNGRGFTITTPIDAYIAESAADLCTRAGLPPWFMLAGPHGEFELVFTVPDRSEAGFLESAHAISWHPIRLGRVTDETEITFMQEHTLRSVDTARVRNCFAHSDRGITEYLRELTSIENSWRQS